MAAALKNSLPQAARHLICCGGFKKGSPVIKLDKKKVKGDIAANALWLDPLLPYISTGERISHFLIADVLLVLDIMFDKQLVYGDQGHAIREARKLGDLASRLKIRNRRSPLSHTTSRQSLTMTRLKRQLSTRQAAHLDSESEDLMQVADFERNRCG